MTNALSTKRSYHPLVVFYFYAGLLDKKYSDMIPCTTLQYWKKQNHEALYGYDWVKDFYAHHHDFNDLVRHRIVFKSARICCRVLDCFTAVFSKTKAYKKSLRKNMLHLISVIDHLLREIPLEKACKIFRISTQQYYRWKNKLNCSASILNLCFQTQPNQLTIAECTVIQDAVNATVNVRKKLAAIRHMLMREGKLYCSPSTFYKYTNLTSVKTEKIRFNKPKSTIQSSRIFEYIHVDTTLLSTIKDGTVRAVIIKDNYSKKVLHQGIVANGASKWIAMLLEEMFSKYGLHNNKEQMTLVSDGGSENKGDVLEWVGNFEGKSLTKKTARTRDFIFTNNEIESTFNIFKNEFLDEMEIYNSVAAEKSLKDFQIYNDNERYPIALYGLTPQEVFDGAIIDKHRFKDNIQQAKNMRYLINKAGKFCDLCSEK